MEGEDACRGELVRDSPDCLDPVYHRHPQVHQDDIRLVLPEQRDGPRAVLGLGHQLEVRLLGNDRGQPGPHHRVIIGHENADAAGDDLRDLATHR